MYEIVEIAAGERAPALAASTVLPLPEHERLSHRPDRSLLAIDTGGLVGRCSCWWRETPRHGARTVGAIGHYAAATRAVGEALLSRACELLASSGCEAAIGPMDGNTWRRYRFIIDRGDHPVFFLEPDNADEWAGYWIQSGFAAFATYSSAINDRLDRVDPRTDTALARLRHAGIVVRPFDQRRPGEELDAIFDLSLAAFSENLLYTPIGREEFVAQYHAVLPHVQNELVLMAEQNGRLVGFMFGVPDLLQARRGETIDTVILKTLAVDPSARGIGLGGALLDLAQRSAHELGFRRAIHALFHDENVSGRISQRYGRRIRRYALFARPLCP